MLDHSTREALARQVASLPTLPQSRVGPKKRLRQREHIRIVRLGQPSRLVFLKSFSEGQCAWGLDRTEHRVLEVLRGCSQTEQPFLFPEPICFLERQRVLAMTLLPGRTLHYPMLFYGVTGFRRSKLLEWYGKLGRGLARLQRACGKLNLDCLVDKEIGREEVQKKTPTIRVLVEAGLDKLVAEQAHLLDRTPRGLSHGDLGSRNILIDRETFGLVDWAYASIRSVFSDPMHLARAAVFSQRRGVRQATAIALARTVLSAWLQASELPFSSTELRTVLKLELCRAYCADGVDERFVKLWPELAAQLTSVVCTLET